MKRAQRVMLCVCCGLHVRPQVVCTMGPTPNGWYLLAARASDGTVYVHPTASFQVGIFLSSVSVQLGSIGGNTTLVITGSGFNAASASANVVLLPVPVSTTFLVREQGAFLLCPPILLPPGGLDLIAAGRRGRR